MLTNLIIVLVTVGVMVSVVFAVWPNQMKVHNDVLKIGGLISIKVPLAQIVNVDFVRKIPERRRLGGSNTVDVQKGYYEIKGMGKAYLNIRVYSPPYISITTRTGKLLVINKLSEGETTAIYEELIGKT